MTRLETKSRARWRRRVGRFVTVTSLVIGAMVLASFALAQAGSTVKGSHAATTRGTTPTVSKGEPNPVSRDHRGGASSGGVTVTSKPRSPRGPICAGWAC